MMDVGVIGGDERFELIEGEIVVMSPKSIAHDRLQNALNLALVRVVPEDHYIGNGSTLQLAENTLIEPDLAVLPKSLYAADQQGFAQPKSGDILLVIEIAVSSLGYDRRAKARLYARHGIREYWVIEANERRTWVHKDSKDGQWTSITECAPGDVLTTPVLPGFSIRLVDL
jgi:Uma2 family endonuclease